jgi:hypothetical protein
MALVAAPAATPANSLDASFSGKVCPLVSPKQVALVVSDLKTVSAYDCVPSPAKKTPQETSYAATWGPSRTLQRGFFTVGIVKYASPAFAGLGRNAYVRMKPLPGIGDWANEEIRTGRVGGGAINTADLGTLAFGAHGYVVLLSVRAARGKHVNRAALRSVAKLLAKQL